LNTYHCLSFGNTFIGSNRLSSDSNGETSIGTNDRGMVDSVDQVASADGVGIGQGLVVVSDHRGSGIGVVDKGGSDSFEDRGGNGFNHRGSDSFDHRGRGSVDIGGSVDIRGSVDIGGSVDSGGNLTDGVNEAVLIVIFRVALKVDIPPSPLGGDKRSGGGVDGAGGSSGG